LIIRQTNDKIAHVLINRTLLFTQPPVQTCSFLPIFEIATMKQSTSHILMIRPAAFGFNTETAASNVFQTKQPALKVQDEALGEFENMVVQLRDAGIRVTVINDTPNLKKPDAIFPNNWFSTHHDGTVVLYPMMAENRRLERRIDILDKLRNQNLVTRLIDLSDEEQREVFLEGTGSIVFDHIQKVAYACNSPRTNEPLFIELCAVLGYTPIAFNAFDVNRQAIYHTNVLLAIGSHWAVCCTESIPERERRALVASLKNQRELIEISFSQMAAFAGNLLELETTHGEKIIVLSQTAYLALGKQQLKKLEMHARLLPISIPSIETVGGGSVRCMMAEVFLPSASTPQS
jgi:hypothetical protein